MRTVVVTGPIGGGKSLLTGLLASAGAAVVLGDELGRQVLALPEVRREIGKAFGPAVVAGGEVDRAALGSLVFGDAAALAALNRITHARLGESARARLEELAAGGQHDLAVFEAAVYFLLPSPPPADLVVAVTAPPPLRLERLLLRDGLDRETASVRIAAQADLESGWARADLTVVNDADIQVLVDACRTIGRRLGLCLEPRPRSSLSLPE